MSGRGEGRTRSGSSPGKRSRIPIPEVESSKRTTLPLEDDPDGTMEFNDTKITSEIGRLNLGETRCPIPSEAQLSTLSAVEIEGLIDTLKKLRDPNLPATAPASTERLPASFLSAGRVERNSITPGVPIPSPSVSFAPVYAPQQRHLQENDTRRYWKTSDVGYFWPDMPASNGPGRYIDFGEKGRAFRDVNAFVSRFIDQIPHLGREVVRNNIHNCLKGAAFAWYNDILPEQAKIDLRSDISERCDRWRDILILNFKLSGAEAMKKIISPSTTYTTFNLRKGESISVWFMDMMSLATDAGLGGDAQKINFAWHKLDSEIRRALPTPREDDTVQHFLLELRRCEENLRDSFMEQERRVMQVAQFAVRQGRMQNPLPPKTTQSAPPLNSRPQLNASRSFPPTGPNATNGANQGRPMSQIYNPGLPKRPCRFCGGQHYDSMCMQRDQYTTKPRGTPGSDAQALFTVDSTGDPEYDLDHQNAMDGFFMVSQGTMDDYELFCSETAKNEEWVDCGHLQQTLECNITPATQGALVKLPTPSPHDRRLQLEPIFTIHHGSSELQFICGTCNFLAPTRNQLFKHLRFFPRHQRTNWWAEQKGLEVYAAEHGIPRVIPSKAPKIPGNGYAFRDYNFLELAVRTVPDGEDIWVCLDTGCGVSLIDAAWIKETLPDAAILNRPSAVKVRGLGDAVHASSQYLLLQLSLPGRNVVGDELIAQINREFHLVPTLGCKILIGTDIIVPEKITIDAANKKVILGECESMEATLRVTPKGRQVVHRAVKTVRDMHIAPWTKRFIPVKYEPLESGRDYEFTPRYTKATAFLASCGGFTRHVVDSHFSAVIYHNRTSNQIKINKNTKIGFIDEFGPVSNHIRLDPMEFPGLADCAESGEWDNEPTPTVSLCPSTLPITFNSPLSKGHFIYSAHHIDTQRKSKYGVSSVIFNENDRITPAQLASLKSITSKHSSVFEDLGSVVDEPEEDWMVITLKPEAKLDSRGPYRVSEKDKEVIDQTFDRMHEEGKMDWGTGGPVGWPVFVVWNKGSGRVVVDIRGLNQSSWGDSYPLPRQDDIIACVKGKDWITTLDLSQAFLQRRLARDSRWLTTVVTHRGQEVFTVTPMGYKNSPAHMQRYMEKLLRSHKAYARCFIDDITIFSETFELHMQHLSAILEVLSQASIYLTASKCHVGYHGARVLGRFVDRFGLSTIEEKTKAIRDMVFPTTLSALETFIGMVGYYQPHIPYYAALVGPLEELKAYLLKPAPKAGKERKKFASTTKGITPTRAQAESFKLLQEALSGSATLIHFDRRVPLFINLDASKEWGYGVTVSQLPQHTMGSLTVAEVAECKHDRSLEKPICYISKKLNKHEKNYWPTELEIACLVWTIRKIRHLVEEAITTIIFTDHNASVDIAKQTAMTNVTAHKQNLRLVRASLYLSQFDKIDIRHMPGRENIAADALSRLQAAATLDIREENEDIYETLQAEAVMVRISDDLVDQFQDGYQKDPFFRSKFNELRRRFFAPGGDINKTFHEYQNLVIEDAEKSTFVTGTEDRPREGTDRRFLLYLKDTGGALRLCIPKNLHESYLQMAHDRHNHSGVERTYDRLRQNYFIKSMSKVVKEYVEHCPSCLTNNTLRHKPYGTLHPIRSPSLPWELVTMDFVVALPHSFPTLHIWKDCTPPVPFYDAVLTITDKFTKSIRLLAGKGTWSAKDWAEAYFDYVYPTMGVPGGIISDRGSVFLSAFWTTLFRLMNTNCIATTAYNPQADGQSERTNQTMEIALRHIVNGRQDNWVEVLGQLQIEHNNATNASTGRSPNELLMLLTPKTIIDLAIPRNVAVSAAAGNERAGVSMSAKLSMIRKESLDALSFAEFAMALQFDRRHELADFRVGDMVYINFARKMDKGYTVAGVNSPKLGPQRAGPFPILEMVGPNACRLGDIPSTWKIWPVISIVNLEKAPLGTDPYQRRTELPPDIEGVERPIEIILDTRLYHGQRQYLVKWKDAPVEQASWLSEDKLEYVEDLVLEFNRTHLNAGKKRKA